MENLCRCDIVNIDVTKSLTRTYAGLVLATGDNNANKFGVNVYRNGEPLDVTGYSVLGYFIRPDMATLPVPGKVEGNTAYVELPSACYTNSGNFSLAIKIAGEDITQTVRVVDGCIRLTQTDAVVDPGEVVPSLDELLLAIEYMETATEEAKAATEEAKAATEEAKAVIEDAAADIDTVYDRVYAHEVDVEWTLGGVLSIVGAPAVAVATSQIYAHNLRVVCDSAVIRHRCHFWYSDYDGDGSNRTVTDWMTGNHFITECVPEKDHGRRISHVQLEFAKTDGAVIGAVSEISEYVKIYALDTYASQGIDAAAKLAEIEEDCTKLAAVVDTKAPAIIIDASGSMVSVTDSAALPARELVSTITAVQEGTGDASTDNVRAIRGWNGVEIYRACNNLLHVKDYEDNRDSYTEVCSNGVITRNVLKQHSTSYTARAENHALTTRLPAGTYTFTLTYISANAKFTGPYAEVTLDSGEVIQLPHGTAVTLDQSGTITGFRCVSTSFTSSAGEIVYTLQIEPGDTATVYKRGQVYPNYCPLPETVYGGALDWKTGLLTVTHACRVLDGTENWVKYVSGQKGYYYITVGTKGSVVDGTGVCSHFVTTLVASTTADMGYYIVNSQAGEARLLIRPDMTAFTDVDTWKAYLAEQYAAGTPVTCTYELAQPYTIQLRFEVPLDMLKGLNNIWSNCGDTSITYVADTKMYIDGKLDEIMSSIINAQQEEQ